MGRQRSNLFPAGAQLVHALFWAWLSRAAEAHFPGSELRKVDVLFASAAQLSYRRGARGRAALARTGRRAPGRRAARIARALCKRRGTVSCVSTHERARSYALSTPRSLSARPEAPSQTATSARAGQTSLAGHRVRSRARLRDAERVFRDSCSDVRELSVARCNSCWRSP